METVPVPPRPALVALQPARLSMTLRTHGIAPRELLVQPAQPSPEQTGWSVLPPFVPPLILDLTGMELGMVAMLLWDLRQRLVRQPSVPLIVAPSTGLAAQRLVVSSRLACVMIASHLPPGTLARWATLAIEIAPEQLWVGLPRPAMPPLDERLVQLLAALAQARDMAQAADWSYLSRRSAYTILGRSARQLGCPADRRQRSPAQWLRLLEAALARDRTARST